LPSTTPPRADLVFPHLDHQQGARFQEPLLSSLEAEAQWVNSVRIFRICLSPHICNLFNPPHVGIQLAKLSGFSPVITTASLKHTEYLKALGATDVLDRSLPDPNLSQKVVEIAKVPVLHVIDAVSLPTTQELGLGLVAPGGQLAVMLDPTVEASEGKAIIFVRSLLGIPDNIKILEDLFQTKASVLVGSGAIRVSFHLSAHNTLVKDFLKIPS